jgi:hypothetical protein
LIFPPQALGANAGAAATTAPRTQGQRRRTRTDVHRVGKRLEPLPGQVLTADDQARRKNLGSNGAEIDPTVWGRWTSSVANYQATAEDVLNGMRGVPAKPAPASFAGTADDNAVDRDRAHVTRVRTDLNALALTPAAGPSFVLAQPHHVHDRGEQRVRIHPPSPQRHPLDAAPPLLS